ncbi:MAG: hypothetical protein K5872_08730 [Rhizobiaceae bacterium]|nr:hypothetical protein [Rhizobiaceae bacterium]MCV0406299.1 hypothetical protein [Rhizobiaceae bacterium]
MKDENARFRALDDLPYFATAEELAIALVGARRAKRWLKEQFPTLKTRPGFPPLDVFHGGYAVPLVRRFYEGVYLGIAGLPAHHVPGGEENWDAWRKRPRQREHTDPRPADPNVGPRLTVEQKAARAKANSAAWQEKKRKALEEHRAKKASVATKTGGGQ